ncbi:MAG: hypothetical protein VXZ18_00745 [Pseudomonadota bacterium]|nr:hypothetical protein [Pseudomonadota bacterium]
MNERDLRVGDLIAFQIGENPDFSAPNKDSWGVVKILDLGDQKDWSFSLSVKSGLWTKKPTKWQAFRTRLLVEKRVKKLGTSGLKPEVLIFTMPVDFAMNLQEAEVIGREFWLTCSERKALRKIRRDGFFYTIAAIDLAPLSIDHEHRAKFDEERWKSESKAYSEKQQSIRRERKQREQQRLKKVTISALIEETQFEDWGNRTQIVPPEFTLGVRKRSRKLLSDLEALGAKPRRKDVRALLKAYISWLNEFDGSFGYSIETGEREDLIVFVEELCWATKQKPLVAEADAWREW